MTFQINDASTSSTNPAVSITITENGDGTLSFSVTQSGAIIGDLRGLFFDVNAVADGTLARSLSISNASAASFLKTGDDSIKDLGNGANMNGLLGSDGGFDAGVSIGSAGLGTDDIRAFSFNLSSSAKALSLDDFANVDFGVRLTSVGTLTSSRSDSSKLLETTSSAINANDDTGSVTENATASGNLLANDANKLATTTVTGWDGGTLGQAMALSNAAGTTLTVNADGSWTLDATGADALGADEVLTYHFSYTATSTSADQTSSDTAGFTVTVHGANDGQINGDDAGEVTENSTAAGNLLTNDHDIDRTDTSITVASFSGGDLGSAVAIDNADGATVTVNADGSWTLDASTADRLSEGESITQNFSYGTSDGHGGTGSANFAVTVRGANDGPVAEDDAGGSVKENETLVGSVAANDSDIDRLDTHTWALVDGSFDGQGSVSMNADGTWSFSAGGAYDGLTEGQSVELSFQYLMTDNHGASDTATVSFTVAGVGSVEPPPPPPVDPEVEVLFNHGNGGNLDSNNGNGNVNGGGLNGDGVDHGFFPQDADKDNTWEGFTSNDTLKIAGYGDAADLTITEGDFGLGDANIADTMFVIGIDGNQTSTRTEDVGSLADYTGLTEEQINVTGNSDIDIIYA
jgi:hypothetical protein